MELDTTEALREGTIVKGYSGFYYVACDGLLYECSLRGKNRKKKVKFLPGDKVLFSVAGARTGAIETVLPRKNELLRPPVANLDQLVILAALYNPVPDLRLIDRLTVFAVWNDIQPVICFNKCDLVSQEEQHLPAYGVSRLFVQYGDRRRRGGGKGCFAGEIFCAGRQFGRGQVQPDKCHQRSMAASYRGNQR